MSNAGFCTGWGAVIPDPTDGAASEVSTTSFWLDWNVGTLSRSFANAVTALKARLAPRTATARI
jgi:hypothetical protein